ncbi:hypothetical protein QZH41_019222, partial [Actinostola sp. cb2023]
MSSVKAIFPSISIKRKPKSQASVPQQLGSTSSQLTPSTSQSSIFRPLTPEASRRIISGDTAFESKAFDGQLNANSSVIAKEHEAESIEIPLCPLPLPLVESKVTTRSPRPQRRPSNHRESLTSVHGRSGSVNSENSVYLDSDLVEAPMVDQEDIIALTYHVRAFSDALGVLRNTFFEQSESPEDKPPEVKAHERLGEVLSILKGVLNQYQPLHSTDILAAAGTLINKVKSHNYEESDQAPEEFCESIDQLALAFSSSVSDFLMGDQDIPLSASRENSRSLEDFADDDEDDEMEEDDGDDMDDDQDDDYYRDDRRGFDKKESAIDKSAQKADELDKTLFGLEHGVDLTLQRTKVWSKYAKDIATYIERRAHLELEFTNKLAKLAQATRASITEDRHLPFQTIYVTSLDQDIDYADSCARTYSSLLSSKFLEPLQNRRSSHEKKRKDLKEIWTKAYKKLNEAIVKLEKAKQTYIQKQQEIEKFKSTNDTKDGQEMSSSSTRTTKKKQDDVRKADEAEEWYKQCVIEANVRQRELLKTKSHVLVELRQLIYQCDQTMKAVTCNFFHLMHSQSTPAPIRFQCLAETSRTYEPGCQFSDFVYDQQAIAQPTVEREFAFEPYTSSDKLSSPTRNNFEARTMHSPTQEIGRTSPFHTTGRTNSLHLSSSQPVKAWGHTLQDHMSDAESTGSKSAPVTPEGSPVTRHKNLHHEALNEDSSDDESTTEVEKEVRPSKGKGRNGSGPFQNVRMSGAAKTHKFKKLRAPSRCRDCDSYVYFNGAECADCGLTCHRKCLARIMNRCDKKVSSLSRNGGRRMTTFGVDFYSHLEATHKQDECVPYIVSLCIKEINNRGLDIKGIYRVSGVKSKVEKVCQVFENSSGAVDLSGIPPHVIAAVLKLYLRQLPEPLLTYKLYPEFIKIAKESLDVTNLGDETSNEYKEVLRKLREVVVKLPRAIFKTVAMVINHLKLISKNKEENQMSACNLGIVFGPTLLRPRESATTDSISMSALVDMQHQTKAVELLINNPQVFDTPGVDDPASQETPVEEFGRDKNQPILSDVCSVRNRDPKSSQTGNNITADGSSSDTPRDDPNDLISENLIEPEKPVKPVQPDEPVDPNTEVTDKKSLGFDNGFLDLLAKSNNRTENEKDQEYSIPEFLLPGSTKEQENDKDADDSYDDSTTQGTSGFCTPDDDLDSSRGSMSRDDFKTEDSPPSLTQNQAISVLPSSFSMPDIAVMSRSSSTYSAATSISFGSDMPDDMLPDFSEPSEWEPKIPDIPIENTSGYVRPYPKKTVDDSSVPSRTRPRPNALGLFKRNSDLPGMMSRLGFFPIASKSSSSETDISKKPPRASEEVLLNPGSSHKKRPGISEALREMHIVYDPILQHAGKPKDTPEKLEDTPEKLKDTPEKLKDTPDKLKDTPDKLKNTPDPGHPRNSRTPRQTQGHPNKLKDTPDKLKDTPDKLKDTPDKLKDTPDKLKDTPDKLKDTPDKLKDTPDKLKEPPGAEDVETESTPFLHETPIVVKTSNDKNTEPKEWYISEQNDIHEMDSKENTIEFEPAENQESSEVENIGGTGSPVVFEVEQEEQNENTVVSELESSGEQTVDGSEEAQDPVREEDYRRDSKPKSPREKSLVNEKSNKVCQSETNAKGSTQDKVSGEPLQKMRSPRVSVRDRRRRYEKTPDNDEQTSEISVASPKPQSPIGNFNIASRKQIFESIDKGAKKDTYKKLSDISKKAKSSSLNASKEDLDQ